MPVVDLVVEIIQAILALAPAIPEAIDLGNSAVSLLKTGAVTAEQEAAIRAQLDAIKAKIDGAC